MLPIAVRLYTTYPDLYLDDMCPQCMLANESFTHLWECIYSCDAIAQIAVEGSTLFWSLVAGLSIGMPGLGFPFFLDHTQWLMLSER